MHNAFSEEPEAKCKHAKCTPLHGWYEETTKEHLDPEVVPPLGCVISGPGRQTVVHVMDGRSQETSYRKPLKQLKHSSC